MKDILSDWWTLCGILRRYKGNCALQPLFRTTTIFATMGSTFVPPQVFPPESGASLAQGKDHEMTDVHSRSTGAHIHVMSPLVIAEGATGGDIKGMYRIQRSSDPEGSSFETDPLSKPDEGAHGDDSKTATPSQTSNILTQMQHPSQRLTREPPVTYDLLTRFKNTFRILDLISEQGSGGLGMSCSSSQGIHNTHCTPFHQLKRSLLIRPLLKHLLM